MSLIAELVSDVKFIIKYRISLMPIQKELDRHAPKVGDMAPDFTLYDSSGIKSITLSDFHGEKPVALVFGSFT